MNDKQIRTGPTPLWLHLNGGVAMMAAASKDDNMLVASQEILSAALNGVKAYHNSVVKPFKRSMQDVTSINGSHFITANEWSDNKDVVIIIPSLINGWGILDIEKDHSFITFLNGQGLTPLVLNWAEPNDNTSLNDYITHHCVPLIQSVMDKGYNIKSVIGYCMGGTIIAALYSAFPKLMKHIDRAVLIAPPWDFSYQSIDQMMRLQSLALQTYAMGDDVPNDFVQSLFWAIDPLQVLKKFRKFPNIQNPDRFVRVEDWLNEGRAVSKSVIQTCLFDWYRENTIVNRNWSVSGATVDDKNLPHQTLIVVGKNDNLVPIESSKPLITNRQLVTVNTGHIGLMASDKSIDNAWKPIAEFLNADTL